MRKEKNTIEIREKKNKMKKFFVLLIICIFLPLNSFADENNCQNIKTVKKYLECKNDPNRSLKKLDIGGTDLKDVKKKFSESKIKKAFDAFKNKKSLSDLTK